MNDRNLSPKLKKYITACVIGNGLECYDFAVFGFFAPVISLQFFPSDSAYISLINTFAVFAIGFLSRPVGAYYFGTSGDIHGRKNAMIVSLSLMAVSTTAIGLLPTYQNIGIWAPIFLTILRILQGISLGGEYTSCMSFILEHAPIRRKGFVGSWINEGTCFGLIFGGVISISISSLLLKDQLETWGWRIPFIFGSIIGPIGYYLRKHLEESPCFVDLKETNSIELKPVKKVFNNCRSSVVRFVCMISPNAVWTYVLSVYIPSYLTKFLNSDFSLSLMLSLVPFFLMAFFIPLFGYLSDLYGKHRFNFFGGVLLVATSPFLFTALSEGNLRHILVAEIFTSIFLSVSVAPLNALISDGFPASIRNSGLAISFNTALAVVGGMTPLILTWSDVAVGKIAGPLLWVAGTGIIGAVASYRNHLIFKSETSLKTEFS